jgi:hypothetical protein
MSAEGIRRDNEIQLPQDSLHKRAMAGNGSRKDKSKKEGLAEAINRKEIPAPVVRLIVNPM